MLIPRAALAAKAGDAALNGPHIKNSRYFGSTNAGSPTPSPWPRAGRPRLRGETGHVWRLFRTRHGPIAYMREHYGGDPEAAGWAQSLPAEDYADVIERYATAA